jgi:nucleotide-binding universal stress UspA family protein
MEAQLSPTGRFEKILLATDGSEFSQGAIRLALAMAQKCGARLVLMSTVITNDEIDTVAPQLIEKAERTAKAHLDAVAADAGRAGVECETLVRHGYEPSREIVAAAEDVKADVIVMGRRGRRGLARWMVGDAVAKVIGHTSASVLVAPRAAQMPQRRLLVATDGSRHADAAAIAAGNLARFCKLPLTVLSVTRDAHSDQRRAEARTTVDRVTAFLGKEGVTAEGVVVHGLPDEVIVATATAKGADLIVVGSHGRTGLQKVLLGSISERVIGRAQTPVLVVRA